MRKKLLTMLLAAAMVVTLPGVGTIGAPSSEAADESMEAQKDDEDPFVDDPIFEEPDELSIFGSADGVEHYSVLKGDSVKLAVGLRAEMDGYKPKEGTVEYQWYKETTHWETDPFDEESQIEVTDETALSDEKKDSVTVTYGESENGSLKFFCKITYQLDVDEGDPYYDQTMEEKVCFSVDGEYEPFRLGTVDDINIQEGEVGDSRAIRCEIIENSNNEVYGCTVDPEKASFQWYQIIGDEEKTLSGETTESLVRKVTEKPQFYYCKATVPVIKGEGANAREFSYVSTSDRLTLKMYSLFEFTESEMTLNGIQGEKITLLAETRNSDYADTLINDEDYKISYAYQWYTVYEGEDGIEVTDTYNCKEKNCTATIQESEVTYFCEVTCTMSKGNSVYSETMNGPRITVSPEAPFFAYADLDNEAESTTLYELAGYEAELKVTPIVNMDREWDNDGELIDEHPKYEITGGYKYQWEKGYYKSKEDREEDILSWKAIDGATSDTFKTKVLLSSDIESYRCAVTGAVDLDDEGTLDYTAYAEYNVHIVSVVLGDITKSEEYCDTGDEIELTANPYIYSEEDDEKVSQGTFYGYTFDLNDDSVQYTWEELKDSEEGEVWVTISGATGQTMKRKVDGSDVRFRLLGTAEKDGQRYSYTFTAEAIKLDENLPVSINFYQGEGSKRENITDHTRPVPYGTQVVLEAEPSYETDIVSDFSVKGYQWYVYDKAKDQYVQLQGKTQNKLSVTVDKYTEYQCCITANATFDEKTREITVEKDCIVAVDNQLKVNLLAIDATGKSVTSATKGQIRLFVTVYAKDMTGIKPEWYYYDSMENPYIDMPDVKGFVYSVDMENAKTAYGVKVIDRYGNNVEEEYRLPEEDDPGLTAEVWENAAGKLVAGKQLVVGQETGDSIDISLYAFLPEKTGALRIYSSEAEDPVGPSGIDPNCYVYDSNGYFVRYEDDYYGSYNFDFIYLCEKGVPIYFLLGRNDAEYYMNVAYMDMEHIHAYDPGTDTCLICGENKTPSKPAGTDNKQTQQPQTQQPQEQTQPAVKAGQKIQLKKQGTFKVTDPDPKKAEVTFVKPANAKAAKIKVPASIKQGGVTYKVTKLDPKAFKGNKKVKEIDLGKNITKVDNKAFSGCTKLKKVTVRSGKIKFGKFLFKGCGSFKTLDIKAKKLAKNSFAKKSLSGMPKNAVVKVPKGTAKYYKNILKNSGKPKSVKIK